MIGSTVINQRQHVGLQKLLVLAATARSLLGANEKYKFIQDEASGESTLVGSCLRILDNLEHTCAVGQLVYESVEAHHKVYRTGSGCLLFLAGAWSRAALECLRSGISPRHIAAAMTEGMDVCIDVCKNSSISFEALCESPQKRITKVPTDSGHMTATGLKASKVKLSRHFCWTESESVSVPQPHLPDIAQLADGLRHGCDDAMDLVLQASCMQLKYGLKDTHCVFDVNKVMTCVLPGFSEDHAHVSQGCVVLLDADQSAVAHSLQDTPLNVALIHGDLSCTYRHLGFNQPTGVQHVNDQSRLPSLSKKEEWMQKILVLLLRLEVDLLLVSGLVGEEVIQCCCKHRMLTVGKVKASIIKEMANATGAVPVAYATQLSKHCVGTGVKVGIWREIQSDRRTCVYIYPSCRTQLVTAVITSFLHSKLQVLEDRFWACAYRLHYALKDKAVLPGAGESEMICVHHLQRQVNVAHPRDGQTNSFRGVVLHLMAEGFVDYISTVMANSAGISQLQAKTAVNQQLQDFKGDHNVSAKLSRLVLDLDERSPQFSAVRSVRPRKVYDNLSVKVEAWRTALDLVLLVLQADAEIITGVEESSRGAQAELNFL
ncbi:Bardet-Biedl syndrome 12 protein isoform X2 [Entelurus aequoreus]|uniref:Bardet-Biedl syndrome 12 protein isoform X2 n=1 Tax=Entelurus aequoreus TaxID=161455 RepID=UPI002B1DF4F4|nr:Bardet-Biedl syndrome 12 protein isoform X2 [Entelurus aequoreus]